MTQPTNEIKTLATSSSGSDGSSNKVEPTGSLNTEGYGKQSLSYQHLNYLMNNHGDWLKYLYEEYIPSYVEPINTAIAVDGTNATANNDFTVTSDLTVGAGTSLNGNMTVAGSATFEDTLSVSGESTLDATTCSSLEVSGASTLNALSATGTTSLSTLGVSSTSTFEGDITCLGAISGGVTGLVISDDTECTYSLDVGTDLTVGGTATVGGQTVITEGTFTGNQQLATSGYQILPGGVILQWGTATVAANVSGVVTLPIAYPTAGCACCASTSINTTLSDDGVGCVFNGLTTIRVYNGQDSSADFTFFTIGY